MEGRRILLIMDKDDGSHRGLSYSLSRAFERSGHVCTLVGFRLNMAVYRLLQYVPSLARLYVVGRQKDLIDRIGRISFDLILVVKGSYLMPSTVDTLRKQLGAPVLCFHPDDPFSSVRGASNPIVRETIGAFDGYLHWGRSILNRIASTYGIPVHHLPFALDDELDVDVQDARVEKVYDVCFLGNCDREREAVMKAISAEAADLDFKGAIFGADWPEIPGFTIHGPVHGPEYMNTFRKSRVNLNILRSQNKSSTNMRTFEVLAAGGFMLHEYSEEVVEMFDPGVHLDTFKSPQECALKIKEWLSDPERLERAAKSGHETAMKHHTYRDRIRTILEFSDKLEEVR